MATITILGKDFNAVLTEGDEIYVIPWESIKEELSNIEYHKFKEWMVGQTISPKGVYPGDLERFLFGKPVID